MFTVGNIFCGYLAIVHAMNGEFERAGFLILLATVLDFLDGKVARLTRSTSPFGLEFDSLADVISFGIAPAVLVHSWGLILLGRIGWTVSFIYVICNATRLARFNIQTAQTDKRYFVGLPVPAAAAVLAAVVFYRPAPLQDPSFKEFDIRRRKPYLHIVGFALLVAAVASAPQQLLLVICFAYLASGLLPRSLPAILWSRLRRQDTVPVERDGGHD
jgi:CDP-diacylglycerol--serine O-phosphatidyltransferase